MEELKEELEAIKFFIKELRNKRSHPAEPDLDLNEKAELKKLYKERKKIKEKIKKLKEERKKNAIKIEL